MQVMDDTTKSLALSLNMRQLKQDIISSNIANSETLIMANA
jgi:flagellar basal body rod protein FlgB